ncbi:hypothetical protein [Bacillus manliponensis]|uniref:hypothetical protein n=1 Tax=Bacillus manliponensis TaxID=574376 RepID=UPI003512825C
MESYNQFPTRSERIKQEQSVYRFSRMQLLFYGMSWTTIQGGAAFWKSIHIVAGTILTIVCCGLLFYLAHNFEKNMRINPTAKWVLASFLYVIGFVCYIRNN